MRSRTLPKHQDWAKANPDAVDFVDRVYFLCEKLYSIGGEEIVELYAPADILQKFKTLNDVRRFIDWFPTLE
jgi:hypothetical protein